tara:strand:+ start:1344 stop:2891 length:1548 start_codon:yes stop_codon:yes gene_type:complete
MRGYRFIRKEKQFKFILKLKQKLTVTKVEIYPKFYDKYLFLNSKNLNKELLIRQLLISRFLNLEFNKSMLSFFGLKKRIIYPLPKSWIKIIIGEGIGIKKFISLILLKFCFLLYLTYSIFYFLKVLRNTFLNPIEKGVLNQDCIYLDNIPENIITSFDSNYIINWFRKNLKNKISEHNNIIISSGNNNKYIKDDENKVFIWNPLSTLKSKRHILSFSIWYFRALFLGLIDIFISEGYRSFLLTESIKTKVFIINNFNSCFKYLYFHNTNWIYRPLWTYTAEQNGAKNVLYFYSANLVHFSNQFHEKDLFSYGWESNTWSNYYVWDFYMKKFLEIPLENPNIEINGIVPFFNKYIDLPAYNIKKNSKVIAIFDVQPVRDSFFQALHQYPYYTPENCIKFMADILEICEEFDYTVIYKGKRSIGSNLHPKYRFFIEGISSKNFFNAPTETPPQQIIELSNAVISLPFTSTSIIANNLNFKTCFYEPTGKIKYSELHTHGIPIFSSKEELREWLNLIN